MATRLGIVLGHDNVRGGFPPGWCDWATSLGRWTAFFLAHSRAAETLARDHRQGRPQARARPPLPYRLLPLAHQRGSLARVGTSWRLWSVFSARGNLIYQSLIGLGSQGLVVFEGDSIMSITKSRFGIAILVAALLCDAVEAQPQPQTITLSSLTSQGFEIKAAANTTFGAAQVFLQKGKDAFVCLVVLPVDAPQRESRCSSID
jgi:hypothetical protein